MILRRSRWVDPHLLFIIILRIYHLAEYCIEILIKEPTLSKKGTEYDLQTLSRLLRSVGIR